MQLKSVTSSHTRFLKNIVSEKQNRRKGTIKTVEIAAGDIKLERGWLENCILIRKRLSPSNFTETTRVA